MPTLSLLLKRCLCTAFLCLLYVTLSQAQGPEAGFGHQTVPNRVVYKLKPQQPVLARSAQSNSMAQALQRIGAKQVRQKFPEVAATQALANARKAGPAVDLTLIHELEYGAGYTFEQVRTALLSTGQVAYVERLYIREPLSQPNDPAADSTKTTQYYLKQVQAYAGWEVEQGDTSVVIGVLDTGFRLSHQDLNTKVKHNYADPIDGIDNDGDGYIDNYSGWDFADKDNNVYDDTPWKGHGTAVAGVAAAATNNATGMAGVGYRSLFMPIKVFSSSPNGPFAGYEAIVYAANKGCKVINLSWGGTGFSEFEQDVINYAVLEKDVLLVASAGNRNTFEDIYPASYDNVLSVGGADKQDVKYKDHTYSYKLDMISPSSGIYSTSLSGDNRYSSFGGTSYASPTVAGGAALVRSRFPELSARQVAERLRATTDHIYGLEGNQPYLEMLGTGRFNLKKALKVQVPTSVRCVAFAPQPKQSLGAGRSIAIDASFINFLSPTSQLEVTLTSLSPYVSITQGSASLGSMVTMGSASTGARPFVIKIAADAPGNQKVYLRLGYSDGTYQDFQHFELFINPSFVTLTANNLHLTLNSEGNIGYNGLNMKQGVGMTYKDGASLLFEGGLLLATNAGVVADNIHNSSWENDRNFTPLSLTSLQFDTPLADQEVRTAMRTNVEGHPLVEVKTAGFAWSGAPNQDFVILEYQVTNRSSETINRLHAGLFADWDIGNYTANMAAWDEELQLGYAYSTTQTLPYAGIKLLTTENQVIYHAIDNVGGNDSTVSVDDGFSNEEKYKIIANGKSRLRAGGSAGNSISHVVGATTLDLAPGQTKTVAFAVLAGDNLEALKQHAQAAQQKYTRIKTGPAPVAAAYETCLAEPVVLAPENGSYFNFYSDAEASNLLHAGKTYTVPTTAPSTTVYVANADSLFLSAAVPMEVTVLPNATAKFRGLPPYIQAGRDFRVKDLSDHATIWMWDFGDGTTSSSQEPTHTYKAPGKYTIELTVMNRLTCTSSSYSQAVTVFDTKLRLYPNPIKDVLAITLTSPLDPDAAPVLQLTDLSGKTITAMPSATDEANVYYNLGSLKAGFYIARLTYQGETYVERVLLRK